jgi:hypothetical protein
MITNEKVLPILSLSLIVVWVSMISLLPNMHLNAQAKVETQKSSTTTPPLESSVPLIQQSAIGDYPNDDNNNTNTKEDILHRGIISSEPGQPEQLKVQRTIILQHRQDGKDYTGILTFSASKPVEVLFGHRLNIDKKLTDIDKKKFGDLFLVSPIHPNTGYVLSAPTVIKPDYKGTAPPYFSASIPFVASSVVLRTLGGVPFIAAYEVSAHIVQPQLINNLTSAESPGTNNTIRR